jgi:hypothetical protein
MDESVCPLFCPRAALMNAIQQLIKSQYGSKMFANESIVKQLT